MRAALTYLMGAIVVLGASVGVSPESGAGLTTPGLSARSWHIIWGAPVSPSFSAARGIAVDGKGNAYVADAGHDQIERVSSSGRLLAVIGRMGTGRGQLDIPTDVTLDAAGNVYVADSQNRRILKFSSTGAYVAQWTKPSGAAFPRFRQPTGVTVDAAGEIYIVDEDTFRVEIMTPGGRGLRTWTITRSAGGDAQRPTSVAVDGHGNVYVASATLRKFSASGKPIPLWGQALASRLPRIEYVTTDRIGNVYAVDRTDSTVAKLSPNGKVLASWGMHGITREPLSLPSAVAVDRAGDLFITDANQQVVKITQGGRVIARWGAHGNGPTQLAHPNGVAWAPDGTLYIADTDNHRIQRLKPDTSVTGTWHVSGTWSSKNANLVAVGGSGNVFSVGAGAGIEKRTPAGVLASTLSLSPGTPSGSVKIQGFALDPQGTIFVSRGDDHRIHVLSPAGVEMAAFPTMTTIGGLVMSPAGLTVDGAEQTYVADAANGRIVKFGPAGEPLAVWGSAGSRPGQFNNPAGVALDSRGDVYVADSGNNRVQELSPLGKVIGVWGSFGAAAGQFSHPSSILVAPSGAVLVADTGNDRVQSLSTSH